MWNQTLKHSKIYKMRISRISNDEHRNGSKTRKKARKEIMLDMLIHLVIQTTIKFLQRMNLMTRKEEHST